MAFAPEGGDGVALQGDQIIYDDYVAECLEEAGFLSSEIKAIFRDNDRLITTISHAQHIQKKGTAEWIAHQREQARERQRKRRANLKAAT